MFVMSIKPQVNNFMSMAAGVMTTDTRMYMMSMRSKYPTMKGVSDAMLRNLRNFESSYNFDLVF